MKKIKFITLILFTLSSNIFAQNLATNILFEQAKTVYKGRVEKIEYLSSNGEGDHFSISTTVEKIYKDTFYFYGHEVNILTIKAYDTIEVVKRIEDYTFQVKKDSSYFFFVKKEREHQKRNGKITFIASFADSQIKGIPFSEELENSIQSYYLFSQVKEQLAYRLLHQSSDLVVVAKIIKINKKENYYTFLIESESGENFKVKTKGLNCICDVGKVNKDKDYLFFLNQIDEENYFLADRWLGIFDYAPISKYIFRLYQENKAAAK